MRIILYFGVKNLEVEIEKLNDSLIELSDLNFDDAIKRNFLVVVNFYATWSPMYRLSLMILDKLEKKFGGRIVFAKADVDKNENNVRKYEVKGIPTFIIFKNGIPVDRIVGHVDESLIEDRIRSYL